MDASDKEKASDHMSYGVSSGWQFGNPSLGLVSTTPAAPSTYQGDQTGAGASPPSSSMTMSSFSHCPWNASANLAASRLSEGGAPSDSLLSFLQSGIGILPPSFPADSAFIQRAARYSCFHDGSLGGMMNPFSTPQFLNPYSNAANGLERAGVQSNEAGMTEAPRNESLPTRGDDPTEDRHQVVNLQASATNKFSQLDSAGGGGQDAAGDSSPKELAAKKRKLTNDDALSNQVQGASQIPAESEMENEEARQKADPKSSSVTTVSSNGKEIKEAPEASKTDYIHIRARRGQATNSHSLAERLRREKISERMKFLQDLVPGCSKVTGKAVMLDEIINYVQSLQRQVEFLSMKLATVSPNLDINVEALLSKDLLQSRSSHPSGMPFPLDVIHSQLHLSQQSLPQPGAGTSGILNSSDLLLRSMDSQMTSVSGYKEQVHQMPNSWNEEIRAMQMGYNSNPTLNL